MNKSYIIVKPDGLHLLDNLINELNVNNIHIDSTYKIADFDHVAINLYLDDDALQRGNAPIIIGINKIWRERYGTTAILLLLSPMDKSPHEDFVKDVCTLKKDFRKKHITNGYISEEIFVENSDYSYYNLPFIEENAKKRAIITGNPMGYELQLNGIHSPDDESALSRELNIIKNCIFFSKNRY